MSQSTASFIAYDLRPAKEIERRMIVDFVRGVSGCGIDLSLYHYLGMGGSAFYRFPDGSPLSWNFGLNKYGAEQGGIRSM